MEGKPEVIRTRQSAWLKTLVDACKSGRNVLVIDDAELGIKPEDLPDGVDLASEQLPGRGFPWVKLFSGMLLISIGLVVAFLFTDLSKGTNDFVSLLRGLLSFIFVAGTFIGSALLFHAMEQELRLFLRANPRPRHSFITSSGVALVVVLVFGTSMAQSHHIFDGPTLPMALWLMVFMAIFADMVLRQLLEALGAQSRKSAQASIQEPRKK